jgi:hypothetical protein
MEVCRKIDTLDSKTVSAVDEEHVVDNPAFPSVFYAALLMLANCSGELPPRGILLVSDEQAVLAHFANAALQRRQHLPDSMHSVKIEVVGNGFIYPLHAYEDHVRGGAHQGLQTSSIEANSHVDQVGKRLIALVAMKESMPVHLNSSDRFVLYRENPRHQVNVLRQLRNVLRGDKGNGEPIALSSDIRLVDVTQQHAAYTNPM